MKIYDDIREYIERTGVSYAALGQRALGRKDLKQRALNKSKLKPATIEILQDFMAQNPNGFEVKQQSKKSADDPCDPLREAREIAARRVYRDPCFKCQVRGDIGCEHQPRDVE